jgi:hypothetical protein
MAGSSLGRAIDELVSQEITLHHGYLTALERERRLVESGDTSELASVTAQREGFLKGIAKAQDSRFTLMRAHLGEPQMQGRQKAPPPSIKLSEFVVRYCPPDEAQALLPKIDILRELVKKSHGKSKEFSQVVSFSLRMVGGLASILWSATKHVVQLYGPRGTMHESVHEPGSRKAGVLKEI